MISMPRGRTNSHQKHVTIVLALDRTFRELGIKEGEFFVLTVITMGSNLPLIVVQYELQGHPRRTEHWALAAIDISEDSAQLFQVKGTPATFEFDTPKHYAIDKSKRYLGGVLVGYIAKNNLETLSQWLQAVPVQHNRNDWDCQNWVIEALQELWMEGRQVVLEGRASERFIRQQLAKEKEFEETGQDMIYERLKSGFGQ